MSAETHLLEQAMMSDDATGAALTRRIGVFGGTFDPVHIGHLILAERAREELRLDRVLFVPAFIPPHKFGGRTISSPDDRRRMLELALISNDAFAISGHEIEREGISYTVDTLRYFRSVLPDSEFTLLIGGDNARDFRLWRKPEEIARMADIAAWARPEHDLPTEILPGVPCRRIAAPLIDVSSTEIRERVSQGRSIRYLTPDAVIEYIRTHDIYTKS